MRTVARTMVLCFMFVGVLFLPACSKRISPELEQAADAMAYMASPRALAQSSFPALLPDGTPRQFVSWLFSDLGTAEWPTADMEEEASSIGVPVLPRNVHVRHSTHILIDKPLIVITWNDSKGVIIIEGYEPSTYEPSLRREVTLPKVEVNPLARETARSNIEMGATFQSF